tara:strand:- start:66 stop:446 length:381 start_codon:yes stop_codon:yes gene_type:complete
MVNIENPKCYTIGYFSDEYNKFLKREKLFSPYLWKREIYSNKESLLKRIQEIINNIEITDDVNLRGHPISIVKDQNNNYLYGNNMEVKKEHWDINRIDEIDKVDYIVYDEDCKYFQYWVEKCDIIN